jgi:D-arabinose 1-dehydrogenase-like Zn-dependent alcohol dehydrogenase
VEVGKNAERFKPGTRVGVPWLGWACGECRYCRSGRENLCEKAKFNGYPLDGGYAEYMATDERFCFATGIHQGFRAAALKEVEMTLSASGSTPPAGPV